MVRPTPQPKTSWYARYPWMAPVLGAAAAFIAVVGFITLSDDGGSDVETPVASSGSVPTSTEQSPPVTPGPPSTVPATSEVPVTTAPPQTTLQPSNEVLVVGQDGYFPWIFPSPTLSWYEEGCPDPESVARDFMANFTGDFDPVFNASAFAGTRGTFDVASRGEGGLPNFGSVSVIEMIRVDPGLQSQGVDCEAWGVLSVTAPAAVTISEPTSGATVGPLVTISGTGSGFEGTINLQVYDERYAPAGSSFAQGGAFAELMPYTGTVTLDRTPIDANVVLVASSSGAADGQVPPFAAVKARYDGSAVQPPALPDPIGPAAVINVAADDVLNARTGAGVQNDILGTIDPFEVGIYQYDASELVGNSPWVLVGNPQSRDFDAWVNAAFLTLVEGEADQTDDFYNTVTGIRAALSQNNGAERLADELSVGGFGPVRVSSDAFFSDDDQLLTITDLFEAGSASDIDRVWGQQDGTGDPIEMTIAEMFAAIENNPALASTDRVGVNERLKFGNTIDNVADYFPGSTVFELHFAGDDQNPDFTWATVRLVFSPDPGGYELVGIALDSWTI